MDKPTAPTDWRDVLDAQGRSLRWLAGKTSKKPRTVYAYSQGTRKAPPEWIESVSKVLGQEVTA